MRRAYQAASLGFLLFALWVMVEASRMSYWISLGPGPGFFPFWLGAALAALSLLWLKQVSGLPADPVEEGFVPDRDGIARILSMVVAIAAFLAVVDVLGFRLSMLGFLLFLLGVVGRQNPWVAIALSLAGSFGVFHLFTGFLDVQLPAASIEFLENLGL